MRIVVSDPACMSDLHKASLLDELIDLPYVIVAPLPLFEDKAISLDEETKRRLIQLGLGVANISEAGVLKAMRYANKYRALRIHDCFALTVAEEPEKAVLLTDDKLLRYVAHDHGLVARGVLWATARIHEYECCSADKLEEGLRILRNDPRVCVPTELNPGRTRRHGPQNALAREGRTYTMPADRRQKG